MAVVSQPGRSIRRGRTTAFVEGAFNVPDQSKSLPGVLSPSSEVNGLERTISEVPSYVTGPAARACGGCHRASLINEASAEGLAAFNQHILQGGYLVAAGEDPDSKLNSVIDQIMAIFE